MAYRPLLCSRLPHFSSPSPLLPQSLPPDSHPSPSFPHPLFPSPFFTFLHSPPSRSETPRGCFRNPGPLLGSARILMKFQLPLLTTC